MPAESEKNLLRFHLNHHLCAIKPNPTKPNPTKPRICLIKTYITIIYDNYIAESVGLRYTDCILYKGLRPHSVILNCIGDEAPVREL